MDLPIPVITLLLTPAVQVAVPAVGVPADIPVDVIPAAVVPPADMVVPAVAILVDALRVDVPPVEDVEFAVVALQVPVHPVPADLQV